jgi:hypothetical protein
MPLPRRVPTPMDPGGGQSLTTGFRPQTGRLPYTLGSLKDEGWLSYIYQ